MENVTNVKCPFCNEPVKEGDPTVTCSVCGATHHVHCWNTSGGCASAACKKSALDANVCSNCGAALRENALFCAKCGTPVKAPEPVAQPISPSAILCAKCGASLPANALFCGECGTPVGQSAAPSAPLCANCGAPLPENALFCGECGARKSTPVATPQPVAPNANACANCGAPLAVNAVFCAECGTPVAINRATPMVAPQENANTPLYAKACELLACADNKESLKKAASFFETLDTYLNSAELLKECKDKLNLIDYNEAIELEKAADSIADYQRAIRIYHELGEYRDSKQRAEFCDGAIKARQNQVAYETAIQKMLEAQTTEELEAAYRMLEKLKGYKDVDQQLLLCLRRIEESTQNVQAIPPQEGFVTEQQAFTTEQQPSFPPKKKKKKKGLLILAIALLVIAALVVLSIFIFIPSYYTSQADDLLRQKQNQQALEIYQDYSNYDSNAQKINAIKAILQMEKGYLTQGIRAMLDAGIPVTVNYRSNSTDAGETVSYQKSNEFIALKSPIYGGYAFANWKIDTYTYNFDSTNTFHVTLVPDLGSSIFAIEYNLAGGTLERENPLQYSPTDAEIVLNNPIRDGYKFIGWTGTDLSEPTMYVTIPSGSMGARWYVANWESAAFKIEYDLAGGVLEQANPTQYNPTDRSFVLNNPTRRGYEFIGWTGTDLNGPTLDVVVPTGSTGNRSYTANWIIAQYTVTFKDVAQSIAVTLNYNYSGVRSDILYLAHGSTFEHPPIPTRSGYLFAGWYTDSACNSPYSFTGTLSSNLTLYAKWIDISRYSSVTVGSSTSIYVYGTSMTYYAFVPLVSGTITVYTTGTVDTYGYLYKSSSLSYCTSDDDGGNNQNFQYTYTVAKGEVYYIGVRGSKNNLLNNAGPATLHISGVAVPNSTVTVNSSVSSNINSLTQLTYNYGSQITTTATVDDKIYLPTPTREGYTFEGWYIGRDRVTGSYISVSENTVLTAKWS